MIIEEEEDELYLLEEENEQKVEELPPDQDEMENVHKTPVETDQAEEGDPKEEVWDAAELDGLATSTDGEEVFTDDSVAEIMKEVVDKAWEDGVVTDDEMAMLEVLKKRLDIDDETFSRIMEESNGTPTAEPLLEEAEEEEHPLPEKSPEEQRREVASTEKKMDIELESEGSNMITLTTSIRSKNRPLGESFDLTQKDGASFKKRCPHCRALIRLHPTEGKNTCPICGRDLIEKKKDSPALRKILDQARSAFKDDDKDTAKELYTIALAQAPDNKEAMFYLRKLQHKMGGKEASGDARNISSISTGSERLDQLMTGGIQVGYQVLLKGPAFCGKEVLMDKIMASALKKGLPVIYVSSNRAMKEVMKGIITQTPDFKSYNQQGLVRMYDLFSKHRDGRVLKEGHRIFNIEVREDFKKFQEDMVSLLEELVREYHGGLMIINSLSPLITQVDQTDLMKFMQMLIARSKSYRFTNILDMAAGVHSESVENSVEYLMDGIIEFKEQDNKNQLKLKGFKNKALTRDWVDYRHSDADITLIGSFMEERIL